LCQAYDVALLDLDGVVYLQEKPVPGAADALVEARSRGMRLEFVTNNASRRADEVAALLGEVGVVAVAEEVVTSAQAAAVELAERFPPGSPVFVLGSEALAAELSDQGLEPVRCADARPVAVVQGYSSEVGWTSLAEACVALNSGAWWVATNTDLTLPSPRGPLPGNGSLVAALAAATGRRPDQIVGKPYPRLHAESVRRSGARSPLVVGDRLDTDIEGAVAAGTDSLLVLTGVTTPGLLLAAPAGRRPTYLAHDLRGLLVGHPEVGTGPSVSQGRWSAHRHGTELLLTCTAEARTDSESEDELDGLRVLCAVAWTDETPAVESSGWRGSIAAEGEAATEALYRWGLQGS
jgi:HAD superfamily hydrolase (TIGR01450 family)